MSLLADLEILHANLLDETSKLIYKILKPGAKCLQYADMLKYITDTAKLVDQTSKPSADALKLLSE